MSTGKPVKRLPYSKKRTEDMVLEASKQFPEKVRPYVQKAAPYIALAGELMSKMQPIVAQLHQKAMEVWALLKPYHPENMLPAIFGLLLAFFGGTFVLTIAAVEAWRSTSWEQNKRDLEVIWKNYKVAADANAKDDGEDKDGDGIADVDQIDPTTLFMRKSGVVLKSVDPDSLSHALGGMYTGFLAIIAALRLQFARAVALGASIGEIISNPASRYVSPHVTALLPTEYKKWGNPIVVWTVKLLSIQVAWILQRIISTVHSAIRGGTMFARGVLAYLSKEKYISPIDDNDTYLDEVVGGVVAVLGFLFQVRMGWSLPFPINILFVPVFILEGFLSYFVAK